MSQRFLINRFNEWRHAGEPLALVTVIATQGSTYSKAGRHLLIRSTGEHAGLVSGGCLEGDLAEHAHNVMQTGTSTLLTYDMRDDADEIWGMGVGCNGLIEVLVQKLAPEENWAPFDALAQAMTRPESCIASLVTQSTDQAIPVGRTCLRDCDGQLMAGDDLPAPDAVPQLSNTEHCSILHWQINPWPRLLLLGAGADAEPVCDMAMNLGWEVVVADHRAALLKTNDFSRADQSLLVEPEKLAQTLSLKDFSACVVMSHHLETDRCYLQQLADNFPLPTGTYAGVLGPAARREKLLANLRTPSTEFVQLLRGPVGLDIGADSPESIALSLLSEIQAVHAQRQGGSISRSPGV
jgi:xanthine dehydrogenase accessory factor